MDARHGQLAKLAAVAAIQARARGRQDRRRTAAKRLISARSADGTFPSALSRLDMDVAKWLRSQPAAPGDVSKLAASMRTEFGVVTLRDLIVAVQDPADWGIFIPGDVGSPAHHRTCDLLWAALQAEVASGLETLSQVRRDAADGPPMWFELARCVIGLTLTPSIYLLPRYQPSASLYLSADCLPRNCYCITLQLGADPLGLHWIESSL